MGLFPSQLYSGSTQYQLICAHIGAYVLHMPSKFPCACLQHPGTLQPRGLAPCRWHSPCDLTIRSQSGKRQYRRLCLSWGRCCGCDSVAAVAAAVVVPTAALAAAAAAAAEGPFAAAATTAAADGFGAILRSSQQQLCVSILLLARASWLSWDWCLHSCALQLHCTRFISLRICTFSLISPPSNLR
jgi:hypothetical protein